MFKVFNFRILTMISTLVVLAGCASFSRNARLHDDHGPHINLTPQAEIDVHVLKSDLYSMNSDWLKAQIELEKALEIQEDSVLRLRLALVIAQRGQYALAEEEIKKVIHKEPKNIDALLALGEVQALQNKGLESITTYKHILTLQTKNYKALIFLGAIYSQLGNIESSKYYFSRLAKIPEHKHLSRYYLGRLYQQVKDHKKAIAQFRRCISEANDFIDCHASLADSYILMGNKKQAIKVLENFKEISQDNERIYAKLYDLYVDEGDSDKAFEQLTVLERFEPQNTYIKLQMAMYFLSQKQIHLTEAKLVEILQISPEFERAIFILVSMFIAEKDLPKAQKYYGQLKKTSPYYADASLVTGRLIEEKLGANKALTFTTKANRSSKEPRLEIYRAILLSRLDQPLKSIKILEKVTSKDVKNTQALYYLGHLQGENGLLDQAIVNMEKVLTIDPDHVDALNYLAYYLSEQKNKLNEALTMAQKANKLRPDDGHIMDTLGWILFQMGKLNEAQVYLERAYVLHPEETVIAEHLALVYSSKGFKDKALQVYNKLLQEGVGQREKILQQINSIKNPSRATASPSKK